MPSTILSGQSTGSTLHALEGPEAATEIQKLRLRYPGVVFHGNTTNPRIAEIVRIENGAQITLSPELCLTGVSLIGANAVIRGAKIHASAINGSVFGGEIRHSKVSSESSVSGGSVSHSTLVGGTRVTDGLINHCAFRSATVTGGTLNHCDVRSATVTGGTLSHSKVRENARILGGLLVHCIVDQGATFSGGSRQHQTISVRDSERSPDLQEHTRGHFGRGRLPRAPHAQFPNVYLNEGGARIQIGDLVSPHPSSGSFAERRRLRLPPPMEVSNDTYDVDPPEWLVDQLISYDLIHEAVITPNGDTFDRQVIEKHINACGNCPVTREPLMLSDLRPNRALQAQITDWKSRQAVTLKGPSIQNVRKQ